MQAVRGKRFTIVILRDGGREALRFEVPRWRLQAARVAALLLAHVVGFTAWQMQGEYGLHGTQIMQLGVLGSAPRFVLFEQVARERPGPTRAELRTRAALARAAQLGLGDRRAASLLLLGEVAPEWTAEAERAGGSDGSLLWPVTSGAYGRGFGSGIDGYHLAIDIQAERGSEVLAAAPGVVGYAGRELRGYGNVVLLVHPGGRVTLYGHNHRNLVVAGERVYQGQAIAEVGSTGRSMGPHLHFELKHASRNCDPMPLMRSQSDPSQRHWPRLSALVWPSDAERPAELRCARRRMHPNPEDSDEEDAFGSEPLASNAVAH